MALAQEAWGLPGALQCFRMCFAPSGVRISFELACLHHVFVHRVLAPCVQDLKSVS